MRKRHRKKNSLKQLSKQVDRLGGIVEKIEEHIINLTTPFHIIDPNTFKVPTYPIPEEVFEQVETLSEPFFSFVKRTAGSIAKVPTSEFKDKVTELRRDNPHLSDNELNTMAVDILAGPPP